MMRTWALVPLLLTLAACDQKMADTAARKPLDPSPMFANGAAARPDIAGTVAVDTDLAPAAAALPAALPLAMLQRGRERFDVFCSPCHAYDGHGEGRVVQRGFPNPPDLHDAAIAALSDRQIFDVATNGYGVMFPYGGRVPAADRWAIVAYIRALQFADHVPAADLTADLRARLEATR
jgi:mono/diheme cytochrome c family protein